MFKKLESVAFITPKNKISSGLDKRYELYQKEKDILKASFANFGNVMDWNDPGIQGKLQDIAKKVVNVTVDRANQNDLISSLLPTEFIDPGDTYVFREIYGPAIFTGTYGAAVQMSRPQFGEYTAVTNLKEVGVRLELTSIQTGKYSASEIGDYVGELIPAFRNRMLFTNTLAGMSVYQASGAQYVSGVGLAVGSMLSAIDALSDTNEPAVIIGRRKAVARLSSNTGFSNETKREWETKGQVGNYAGIPVMKVNSFTDQDYGTIYPMPEDELWMFSEAPAGRIVMTGALRTSSETVPRSESFNLYFRFDDGVGIWHTDRIVRIAAIS